MSTINKLSDEILLFIFTFNSEQLSFKPIHDALKTTLATSHVCKRWRGITLKHPILWSNSFDISAPFPLIINVINPRIRDHRIDTIMIPNVPPFSRHNPGMPREAIRINPPFENGVTRTFLNLDIKLDDFPRRLLYVLKLLPVTDKLFLKIPYYGWMLLDMFFDSPISHLDTLVLQRDGNVYESREISTVNKLSRALANATSVWKMRTLWLKGCNVHLNSPALAGVENLVLAGTPLCVAFTPNELLEALKGMPKLRRLLLEPSKLSPAGQMSKFVATPVDLPRLVEFFIYGTPGSVGELVSGLVFPKYSSWTMIGKGVVSLQGNISPITNMLHQIRVAFRKQSPSRWNSFSLYMQPLQCIVRMHKHAPPLNRYPIALDCSASWFGSAPGSFELVFFWNPALFSPPFLGAQPRIDPSKLLSQLGSHLPKTCRGIFRLHLDYDLSSLIAPAEHENLMFDFLSHFSKVKVLNIVNHNTAEFIMPYLKFPYDGTTVHDPLKELNVIFFVCVDFAKMYSWPVAQVPYPPVQLKQMLLEYVVRRTRNEALEPIREINFRRCTGITLEDTRVLVTLGVTLSVSNDIQ